MSSINRNKQTPGEGEPALAPGRHVESRGRGRSSAAIATALSLLSPALHAQEFTLNGLADLSLVRSSDQRTWLDGGLGKLRYGDGQHRGTDAQLAEIALDGRALISPDLLAFASVRYEPKQKTAFDILEAYGRYQPVSTGSFEWTVKLGAFFPPISLENEGIGWTSPWTITPSAINSWVGEELRTIGGEANAEWRFGTSAVAITGAVFGWDDPAGTLLADRGWALDDRPTGLLDHVRLPDALAYQFGTTAPMIQAPFTEIDDAPGWYGGLSWRESDLGRVTLLHYDNRSNPSARRNGEIAWRTQFTGAGIETYLGEIVILGQGMVGDTEIAPNPRFRMVTHFDAAYLLGGWSRNDWTVACRADVFATRTEANPDLSEHGRALTFDVTWRPRSWLRLSSEALWVDSTRQLRSDAGIAPRVYETQLQLSARFLY